MIPHDERQIDVAVARREAAVRQASDEVNSKNFFAETLIATLRERACECHGGELIGHLRHGRQGLDSDQAAQARAIASACSLGMAPVAERGEVISTRVSVPASSSMNDSSQCRSLPGSNAIRTVPAASLLRKRPSRRSSRS